MMKMAVVGAGAIAVKMSNTIAGLDNVEAYAISDLSLERAQAFAKEHNFTKAYGSTEEMLADENIDLVYIAVPNTLHYACVKQALEAGKNVLCEKPFCINTKQTKEVLALAEEKNLLLTEAIWTRYMPSRKMIDDIIKSGKIGEVTSLTANIGYELSEVPRIWDTKFAGGALLDCGIYLLHFARMIFGEREAKVTSDAVMKSGVDMCSSITMNFNNEQMATMQTNVHAVQNRNGSIFGTKGYMEITNINNPEEIKVFDEEYNQIEHFIVPEQITGYEYEVLACQRTLTNGEIECEEIPHAETIKVMEIMDGIRDSWGYKFPGEE